VPTIVGGMLERSNGGGLTVTSDLDDVLAIAAPVPFLSSRAQRRKPHRHRAFSSFRPFGFDYGHRVGERTTRSKGAKGCERATSVLPHHRAVVEINRCLLVSPSYRFGSPPPSNACRRPLT
jgi:hypothetical protein